MSSSSKFFFILVVLLSLIGLFFVFEASTVESFKLFGHQYYFFKQQSFWLAISFVILFLVSKINVKFFEKFALHFYILSIFLLILTLIPGIGLKLNGARRWISLPFGTLQPVEIFKFVLINFYAYLLSKKLDLKSFLFFFNLANNFSFTATRLWFFDDFSSQQFYCLFFSRWRN